MFTPTVQVPEKFTHKSNTTQICATKCSKQALQHKYMRERPWLCLHYMSIFFASSSHNSDNISVHLKTHTHLSGPISCSGGWVPELFSLQTAEKGRTQTTARDVTFNYKREGSAPEVMLPNRIRQLYVETCVGKYVNWSCAQVFHMSPHVTETKSQVASFQTYI